MEEYVEKVDELITEIYGFFQQKLEIEDIKKYEREFLYLEKLMKEVKRQEVMMK